MEFLKEILKRFCDEYDVRIHRYRFVYQEGSFLMMKQNEKVSIKDLTSEDEIDIVNDESGSKLFLMLKSMYDNLK